MKNIQVYQDFENTIENLERENFKFLLEESPISAAKFKQILFSEIRRNKQMQEAFIKNPQSIIASILHCAEMGLNPSGLVGEFYFLAKSNGIVPYVGYKGLITLLLRSNKITKIWSEIVYKGDDFEYELGLEPKLVHIPNHNTLRNSTTMEFVYSCVKFSDGDTQFNVLSKLEVKELAKLNESGNDFIFNDAKDPQSWMIKKTSLKQLAKTLPKQDDIVKKAISLDDSIEGGDYVILDDNENVSLIKGKFLGKTSIYGNLSKNIVDD